MPKLHKSEVADRLCDRLTELSIDARRKVKWQNPTIMDKYSKSLDIVIYKQNVPICLIIVKSWYAQSREVTDSEMHIYKSYNLPVLMCRNEHDTKRIVKEVAGMVYGD